MRTVTEVRPDYPTEWAALKAVAAKLGIGSAETARTWVRKAQVDNIGVDAVREVRRQPHREGIPAARRTAAPLMRDLGLEGARRGRKIRTTSRDDGHERTSDLLERDFTASRPNERRVAGFTGVSTWSGIVYVAFLGDVFSRTIAGRPATTSKRSKLVLDALDALDALDKETGGFSVTTGALP
ncbi:hypothetical protein [Streptomyces glaucus]|uniref:hypothetical protein n=1 Tax=Streptomyces glaucus TaxID=284029 RepID=UPI0031E20A29